MTKGILRSHPRVSGHAFQVGVRVQGSCRLGAGVEGCDSLHLFIGFGYWRCSRASLSSHAGLREMAGVLDKTDVVGTCETKGLQPGDGC